MLENNKSTEILGENDELAQKLGRLIVKDDRDQLYQIASLLPKETSHKTYKYWWTNGWWGDQGNTPHCVAYSWTHWLAAGPITQKHSRPNGQAPYDVVELYNNAQKVDQWVGEDYDGTSVRAGASILKKTGFIKSYSWAWDIDTTINAVLTLGPVVVGTYWKYDMFFPNKNGLITATGRNMGGHAYLLDGVNTKTKMFRIKNSWGKNWGKNGFAYISFDDMETLINLNGEICLSTEINKI